MKSPLIDQTTSLVSYKVTINGEQIREEYQISDIEIETNLNKLPLATISILDGNPYEQRMQVMDENNWKPGDDIKIEIGYHQQLMPVFEGIVSSVGYNSSGDRHGKTTINATDKCVGLTLTKDNDYFAKKKDSEIAKQILQTYGIDCKVDSTKTTHAKIVQYNASDWDFLLSRAKACERVVIAEFNKYHFVKPGSGGKTVQLTYGDDIIDFDLQVDAKTQRKEIEIKGWDASNHSFKTASSSEPDLDKQGSSDVKGPKLAESLKLEKETLYLPTALDTQELKDMANSKLLHSRLARTRGKITMQGIADLKLDSYIEMKKVHDYYKGEMYVTGVRHIVQQGNYMTEAIIGLDEHSFDPEHTEGTTPDNMGLMPAPRGIFIGEVTKMSGDPDNDFRVQVKIPSFKEDDEGLWAKLSSTSASADSGFIWYPEIGDQVVVAFLMNDPRFPVILGSLYSRTHSAYSDHEPADGNNQKALVTRSHMKLVFEEDKKIITLTTPGGNFLEINDDAQSITLKDQHNNKIVMDSSGILIDSPKTITVNAGQKIDMDAVGKFTAKGASIHLEGKGGSALLKAAAEAKVDGGMAKVTASGVTTINGSLVKLN
jgi:Rhs element Vgr protein